MPRALAGTHGFEESEMSWYETEGNGDAMELSPRRSDLYGDRDPMEQDDDPEELEEEDDDLDEDEDEDDDDLDEDEDDDYDDEEEETDEDEGVSRYVPANLSVPSPRGPCRAASFRRCPVSAPSAAPVSPHPPRDSSSASRRRNRLDRPHRADPRRSTRHIHLPGRFGPRAILEASRQVEFFDEELDREPFEIGVTTLEEIEIDPADLEAGMRRLEETVEAVAEKGIVPFTLGGEHSLTLAPVAALQRRFPALSVLQLDAHLDLRDSYQGTKLSHASVMRRIRDLGIPTVAVGIRSVSREEADYVHAEKAPVYLGREIRAKGLPVEEIVERLGTPSTYASISTSSIRPIVPGVGTRARWPHVGRGLRLLRAVFERRQVVGMDLVELCPIPGRSSPTSSPPSSRTR
jgi:agmatinase